MKVKCRQGYEPQQKRRVTGREVGSGDRVAEIRQHLGDAAHAGPADAHEVEAPRLTTSSCAAFAPTWKNNRLVWTFDLTVVKLMMVKVSIIRVEQVKMVRILRRRRLDTPRKGSSSTVMVGFLSRW